MKNQRSLLGGMVFHIGGYTALLLSLCINKSIWWGILHMLCGWFYIIYLLVNKTEFPDYINGFIK